MSRASQRDCAARMLPLRTRLAALRRRARVALAVRGASTLSVAAVGLALVSFGLDRSLRLAWETRLVGLVLALSAVLAVLYRRLWRPLRAPLGDATLARRVEAVHTDLDWRLVSAVEFTAPGWRAGPETSARLVERAVEEALSVCEGRSFGAAVPAAPAARAGARGGVVLLAGVALVLAWPQAAAVWARRNLLLDPHADWPRDTRLELLSLTADGQPVPLRADGSAVVARGVDLGIRVRARGVVPRRVLLESHAGGASEERALDGLAGGEFRTTLERVGSSFRFWLRGGDGEAGPFAVTVLERPWVGALALRVEPPAYTGLPARRFALTASNVAIPRGARVVLRAECSKPLARAGLWERDEDEGVARVHTATLLEGGAGFEVDLLLEHSAFFELRVTDRDGLTPAEETRFGLVAVADQSPQVRLRLEGVGLSVTPGATLRFALEARDDHGVAAAALRHRVQGGEEEAVEGALPLRLDAEGRATGELELGPLELEPKAALALWGEARDRDPRGPNLGSSPTIQLRVVSPEELLNELLRRLHEQRLELERLAAEEERLAGALQAAQAPAVERAAPTQADAGRVLERAAGAVDGVVAELRANHLLDGRTYRRLSEEVAGALRAVAEGTLARARERCEAAADDRGEATARAAGEAVARVAQEVRAIVARMGRLEELAELVAALKQLISEQRELMEEARRRAR
ncbi:MAG: hypothetical protein D6731_12570 [Planctomycetota bacterium]|nr:MAG: hypothetical protein D6731_12570 [Planctomycetota bacterium]